MGFSVGLGGLCPATVRRRLNHGDDMPFGPYNEYDAPDILAELARLLALGEDGATYLHLSSRFGNPDREFDNALDALILEGRISLKPCRIEDCHPYWGGRFKYHLNRSAYEAMEEVSPGLKIRRKPRGRVTIKR